MFDEFKSSNYLEYLSGKRCIITGNRRTQAHHESILPGFSGAQKKQCDFTALPLSVRLHIQRHQMGKIKFWKAYKRDPAQLVIRLLEKYIDNHGTDRDTALQVLQMVKDANT